MGKNYLEAESFFAKKDYNKALPLYLKLIKNNPSDYFLLSRIGLIYHLKGNYYKAIEYYEQSLKINEQQPDIRNNLGLLYRTFNKFDKAIACFKKNLNSYENLFNIGILFEKIGKIKEAKQFLHKAIKVNPKKKFPLLIRSSFMLPTIYMNKEEILKYREKILNFIKRYNSYQEKINNPIIDIGYTTFYLGYHGMDNKNINKKIADFYFNHINEAFFVECSKKKRYNKKIKIGFVSAFLRKHSVSDVSRGWIGRLDNKQFEKIIFSLGEYNDTSIKFFKKTCDKVVFLPQDIKKIHENILKEELDILFFTDIGLEPVTYFLAFSRLAPVQITYTGHPDTTGIKNIDYYISSKLWEKEDANIFYSEKLVKFNSLTWYYEKPKINLSNLKNKEYFGFSNNDNIYCLNQSLFKIHPDMDYILNEILEKDKQAKIAIFYDEKFYFWKNLLFKRFEKNINKIDRIIFIPKLKFDYYLNFLKISDIVLDTLYFNGGTTSLQTLGIGTPIITLPTELARGRFSYGFYKKIGIDDLIASNFDEYIEIAVNVVKNKELNKSIRKKILSNNNTLFEDKMVVKEFENFFKNCVNI